MQMFVPEPGRLPLFPIASPSLPLSFPFCLHYNTKAHLNPFLNAAATQFIGRRRQAASLCRRAKREWLP